MEPKFTEIGLRFARRLEIGAEFGGRDAIKCAVAKGLGIGFVSKCHVVGDIEAGRIKVLKVPELKLKRIMCITVHKKRQDNPLVQTFIAFLKYYKERRWS